MNISHSVIKIRQRRAIKPLHIFLTTLMALILSGISVQAQILVGVGIGSENMHISSYKPRQLAPHINVEYITSDMRGTIFFDVTGFRKKIDYTGAFTDGQGQIIPYQANDAYDRIIMHLGFKKMLTGDIDAKKLVLFTGGGFANCLSLTKTITKGSDPQFPFEQTVKRTENSYGLTFLAGVQYYLSPIIIELKGNLDFLLKKVNAYDGDTNIHTNTRLTILLPLKSL